MRINQRLVAKSTKRQPGDTERELEALARQEDIFKKMKRAANCIIEAFQNLGKMIADAVQPILNAIGGVFSEIGEEELRQNVTQQLPEFPKLHRFRKDLL